MDAIIALGGLAFIVGLAIKLAKHTRPNHSGPAASPSPRVPKAPPPRPNIHRVTVTAPDRSPRVAPRPASAKARITGRAWVIDGDTIVVNDHRLRLFGIDAPEIEHPYGQKAKWAMVRLCKGHTVTAEIVEIDAHGRSVAKCTLDDGRDLSAELVKEGLAIDWPKYSGRLYSPMEVPGVRKKLWRAHNRQTIGRFEY